MKKRIVRLFTVIIVFMSVFSLSKNSIYAIDTTQDGLKLTSQSDKNSYKKGENINTTLTVTNTNAYDMKNVNIHISVPNEFIIEETDFNIPLLKGNETKEYKVTFTENGSDIIVKPSDDNTNKNDTETSNSEKKSNVDTGDSLTNMMIIGIAGITVLSCITAVFLKKKRQLKKLFIFALISAMALSVTSTKAVYAENSAMAEKHIYLTQPFIYDNKTYEMDIDVKYMISSDETISNGEITREEWITQLLSVFEFSINDREYSFTDYAEAKNPKTIETAIQYSVIDIKDNEAFHPTEYATREFVAYSAIKALRFINTSKGVLQCSDQAILQYPDEVYLAVQNGMFNLIDNQFRPNQYVSKEETNQVIKIIHEILNSCKINDNNQNHIDYQDNVKEINEDYQILSNNIIKISNVNDLNKGDFAVLSNTNGEGIAIEVKDITQVSDNDYNIQYDEAQIENILESLHIEGIENNSKSTFIPEDDVIVENQSQFTSRANYDSIPLNKELKLSTKIKDLSASLSLNLEEIQYRFDLDYSLFGGLKLNDAYFALATDINANLTYEGDENLIERDDPEKIEKKIGVIKIPLQYGFSVDCDVYLTGTINGKLEINVTLSNTTGFQYVKNNFRTIADTETELAKMEISASARFGVKPVAGIEWMNFDIANVNANVGIGVDGKVENQLIEPYQFCIDAKAYLYASIGEELLPDITDKLSNDVDIYTAQRSPFKISGHFEETGKVDKCTRDETDDNEDILTVKKGETVRVYNTSEQYDNNIILHGKNNAVIDFASYTPYGSDAVNGRAYPNEPVGEHWEMYFDRKDYCDITVLEGEIIIDKKTADGNFKVEKADHPSLIRYEMKAGDTWEFELKENHKNDPIDTCIYFNAIKGILKVTENNYDIESSELLSSLEYQYDHEECTQNLYLEYNEIYGITKGVVTCTEGTIDIYVRYDTKDSFNIYS